VRRQIGDNRAHDSAFIDNYRFLARYNAWFNERLYGACDGLTDAQRLQDHGAFFGSIHGTLNHLVWGDTMWLQRFAAQGEAFAAFGGGVLACRRAPVRHGAGVRLGRAESPARTAGRGR
jgi:hypothetical protein